MKLAKPPESATTLLRSPVANGVDEAYSKTPTMVERSGRCSEDIPSEDGGSLVKHMKRCPPPFMHVDIRFGTESKIDATHFGDIKQFEFFYTTSLQWSLPPADLDSYKM